MVPSHRPNRAGGPSTCISLQQSKSRTHLDRSYLLPDSQTAIPLAGDDNANYPLHITYVPERRNSINMRRISSLSISASRRALLPKGYCQPRRWAGNVPGALEETFKIGFIGLGNMGGPMASNLLKKYSDLLVYDVVPENVEKLVEEGATGAASVKEIAQKCNVVITMVPATEHVFSVLRGPDGVMENARDDTLLIDCSTIDPGASKQLYQEANQKCLRMIDAPVSGGVGGAAAGTLTFMIGGNETDVNSVESILHCMGKKVVHCGESGSGGIVKLCNNMAMAISMIGISEAMSLVSPKKPSH